VQINRDIDILFVVNNGGLMVEEQVSLAANFQRFLDVLAVIEGGLPSVNIGVISTDVGAGPFPISGCAGNGDNGVLQSTRGEAAPVGCTGPSGAFIQDWDDGAGGRLRNYDVDQGLAATFSCIAQLGITGCGFEQQLESMSAPQRLGGQQRQLPRAPGRLPGHHLHHRRGRLLDPGHRHVRHRRPPSPTRSARCPRTAASSTASTARSATATAARSARA
jgi:hypothetical protein